MENKFIIHLIRRTSIRQLTWPVGGNVAFLSFFLSLFFFLVKWFLFKLKVLGKISSLEYVKLDRRVKHESVL